jgi:hypothetical protein
MSPATVTIIAASYIIGIHSALQIVSQEYCTRYEVLGIVVANVLLLSMQNCGMIDRWPKRQQPSDAQDHNFLGARATA